MKTMKVTLAAIAVAAYAETDTVLVDYTPKMLRFTVQDGVWTQQVDFAKRWTLDGIDTSFAAVASDGRRVFIGEGVSQTHFGIRS